MFDITKNQMIKINKGDDSGNFPLFVNMGTPLQPIQYKFYRSFEILKAPEQLVIVSDKNVFGAKLENDGFYTFEYNYLYNESGIKIGALGWYFNSEIVNMSDYGFTITGTPAIGDKIIVAQFRINKSEVYFYILPVNADLDHCLIKKTFCIDGNITTEFADCRLETIDYSSADITDEKHRMILNFIPEDTFYLPSGEYQYQIRAKLYDYEAGEFVLNTITHRLPFFIIDGEDGVIW